ncbi:molybdopterin oxidoreductase family protein [Mycobacterium sp. E1747]|uniref:molybdopterin oxidoreductase family protein n=1 Tax=Mycobacterium sp. E1747 TaxID=1834128 RepID=UPI0008011B12|nr:molybdopterin oxidoreductase family protein [Mycobacterium sp. E1747]OBH03716.1 nitrite reductase [Mycobacterium sp. E1747]
MAPAPTKTHCPYCSLQCGITLDVSGSRIELAPQGEFPTNRGGLCAKGWTAADLLGHPERLTGPQVRDGRGSPLRPATWNEALERVVAAFQRAQRDHGPDAVGCFGGGGLTNEKAYQLGKFARIALRTSAIDYNGRFCMSSAAAATNRSFGIDRGLPFPLADIAQAEVILLVGSNPAETMPPAMQFFDEGRASGAKHIVVDPRRTATAARADLHLQPVPGTDLALANGMLNVIAREGLIDERYVNERTAGFEAVRRAVRLYWPDRVERITGVPENDIVTAARMLAKADRAMILTARGAEQHSTGTDTVQAFINLALALGLPGRPYSGFATITGQGNGQGGREHGQKCDQLPGYRRLDDPIARSHVARIWGINPADLPSSGRSAYEMLSAIGSAGGVRALWVLASNIAVSAPNALHVGDKLKDLDFLVVSDIFLSETAALADVVLPTTQWAEESGTMTNLEGRVILRRAAVAPPGDVRSDLDVMADLAKRLGAQGFSAEPQEVFEELSRASQGGKADYRGISYERIAAADGVFWPCPSAMYPDTPRLFVEDFPTPDRRAHFHATEHRAAAELPDDQYPYYLTTGRVLRHYQSGTQTRRVAKLSEGASDPVAELHPTLAQRVGVGDGDQVRLATRRGEVVMTARLDSGIRPDTVFAPFHWGGASCINRLTNPALDQTSRMPSFKVCAVAVSAVATPVNPGTSKEGDYPHG